MGSMSLVHWLVVGVIVILLFGGSRFSNMMGDVAKGIKNFKKGMAEDDETPPAREPTRIEAQKAAEPAYKPEVERAREEQR
jgi:sec-independent protein translocase protein TatA